MLNEGPVYIRTTSYLFLLTRGRPFVLPLLLRAHSSIRITYSHHGRTTSRTRVYEKACLLVQRITEKNSSRKLVFRYSGFSEVWPRRRASPRRRPTLRTAARRSLRSPLPPDSRASRPLPLPEPSPCTPQRRLAGSSSQRSQPQ